MATATNNPYKNHYPEKFPELHKQLVLLEGNLKEPWYASFLLFDSSISERLETFLLIVTFLSYLMSVATGAGWLLQFPKPAHELTAISFSIATACTLFWVLRWRFNKSLQAVNNNYIANFAKSIPEAMLVEITICLRDLSKLDPVMSVHAEQTLEESDVPRRLALHLVSNPTPLTILKATEYLLSEDTFLQEFDSDDEWPSLDCNSDHFYLTYTGYLEHIHSLELSVARDIAQQNAEKLAEEKLAALTLKFSH